MVTSKFRKRKIKRTYDTEDDIIFARCIFRTEHNPFYLRNEEHEGIFQHANGLVNGNLANNAVAGNGAGGGDRDNGDNVVWSFLPSLWMRPLVTTSAA